jgi:hypothetical protein
MLKVLRKHRWFATVAQIALLLGPSSEVFAAVTATPVYVQTPNFGQAISNGATAVGLYTGGANGSKCVGAWASNTQAATAYNLSLVIVSTNTATYETISIPGNAGLSTTQAAINLMSSANWPGLPRDSDGNPFFYLKSAAVINIISAAAASAFLQAGIVCGDF